MTKLIPRIYSKPGRPNPRGLWLILVFVLIGIGAGPQLQAAETWLKTAVGLPEGVLFVGPSAINNRGEIVGGAFMQEGDHYVHRGFVYRDGAWIILGTLGGLNSKATAINEHGQVVGYSDTKIVHQDEGEGCDDFGSCGPEQHAFLWDGSMEDLGAVGAWSKA